MENHSEELDIDSELLNQSNNQTGVKQHFINGDKYELLKSYQSIISKLTEVSPTLRKLVNDLICTENLERIKDVMVSKYVE